MRSQNSAIVDKLLTNVSNGYVPEGYIAEQVLPALPVAQTTGKIGKYTNNHLRIVNTAHTGKGGYQRLESVTVTSDTYSIQDHGLTDIITENDFRNFEQPFDARRDTTMALTTAHALAKEYGLAQTLTNGSIITQGVTLSGTSQYDEINNADSKPLEDSIAAHNAIELATGFPANTVIMNPKIARYLMCHAQLLSSLGFKYDRPGGLNMEELARALKVERVLVARAMYNSSKEGQADSMAFVWGNDVVYARIVAPGLMQKTLGYEVRKSGTTPREVRRWTNNEPFNSETVAVADNYDQLILNATAAYLIQDAI